MYRVDPNGQAAPMQSTNQGAMTIAAPAAGALPDPRRLGLRLLAIVAAAGLLAVGIASLPGLDEVRGQFADATRAGSPLPSP